MTQKWKSELYDNNHSFVSKYGEELIPLLAPKANEFILDMGCGTGDLAQQVHEAGAVVTGMDYSQDMIDQAQKKYPHIAFVRADATNFQYDRFFDGVLSNATLHWIKDADKVLINTYAALKVGGRFVAEFGGANNVQLIENGLRKILKRYGHDLGTPWYFPSIGQYTTKMEQAGFRVVFATHFDRMTELADGKNGLRNWVQMFAVGFFKQLSEQDIETILKELEAELEPHLFSNGKWYADYTRIRVIGRKE